jgi:hypothetical protein
MIIIDSREKQFNHITDYFQTHLVPFQVEKLETGDYLNTDNPSVLVDRKANLEEVNNNLSKGKSKHARFVRECQRAFSDHVRMVVLIEGTNYRSVEDIKTWQSKYSTHTGKWLANEMFRLTMAYGIEWQFCRKNETPKRILEILGYDERRDQANSDDAGADATVRNQGQP